jgi:hypothetical protein
MQACDLLTILALMKVLYQSMWRAKLLRVLTNLIFAIFDVVLIVVNRPTVFTTKFFFCFFYIILVFKGASLAAVSLIR